MVDNSNVKKWHINQSIYKAIVDDLKSNSDYEDEFIESFLKDFVIEYTSKFLGDK